MQRILTILIVCLTGLALGGLSAHLALRESLGIGGIRAGAWTAWPFASGADADPYTVARVSRDGTIPLGASEGLAFEATGDDGGRALDLACDYTISGMTPPAKLWTLAAYDGRGKLVKSVSGYPAAMQSARLLRFADGSFRIQVSSKPRSGNWLAISGEGSFQLVLSIYDTPVTGSTGMAAPVMPSIRFEGCPQ